MYRTVDASIGDGLYTGATDKWRAHLLFIPNKAYNNPFISLRRVDLLFEYIRRHALHLLSFPEKAQRPSSKKHLRPKVRFESRAMDPFFGQQQQQQRRERNMSLALLIEPHKSSS